MFHHVLLAPVPDDHTGANIRFFVRFLLERLNPVAMNRLRQIGTDDSWANVHAILNLTQGMTVTKLLQLSFEVFQGQLPSAELLKCIMLVYCFSHFSKNWKNDIGRAFSDKEDRLAVLAALTEMTTIADPLALDKYVKAFTILLLSKTESPVLKAARRVIGQPDAPAGAEE